MERLNCISFDQQSYGSIFTHTRSHMYIRRTRFTKTLPTGNITRTFKIWKSQWSPIPTTMKSNVGVCWRLKFDMPKNFRFYYCDLGDVDMGGMNELASNDKNAGALQGTADAHIPCAISMKEYWQFAIFWNLKLRTVLGMSLHVARLSLIGSVKLRTCHCLMKHFQRTLLRLKKCRTRKWITLIFICTKIVGREKRRRIQLNLLKLVACRMPHATCCAPSSVCFMTYMCFVGSHSSCTFFLCHVCSTCNHENQK